MKDYFGDDVFKIICSYVPFSGGDYLNLMLVCKSWLKIGREILSESVLIMGMCWSIEKGFLNESFE